MPGSRIIPAHRGLQQPNRRELTAAIAFLQRRQFPLAVPPPLLETWSFAPAYGEGSFSRAPALQGASLAYRFEVS